MNFSHPQHNAFGFYPSCCTDDPFLLLSSIPKTMVHIWISQGLPIHPLKDVWMLTVFGDYKKSCENFPQFSSCFVHEGLALGQISPCFSVLWNYRAGWGLQLGGRGIRFEGEAETGPQATLGGLTVP